MTGYIVKRMPDGVLFILLMRECGHVFKVFSGLYTHKEFGGVFGVIMKICLKK